MRTGLLALAASFLSARAALAAPQAPASKPGKAPVQILFIGERGGYQPPTGIAGDYLEHGPRQETGNGTFGSIGASLETPRPQPSSKPRDAFRPRDPASLKRRPPPPAASEAPGAGDERRGFSLWEGLSSPLELPPEKVSELSEDEASQAGRRDYESHILGARLDPEAALSGPRAPEARSDGAAREVFAAVDLDLRAGPSGLKDALAALAKGAGFRLDPRFEPVSSGLSQERASVSGWLPAERIGEAARMPGVARLIFDSGPPRPPAGASIETLLGLRLPEPAGASASRAAVKTLRELALDAGFRWKKTIGYQRIPGSGRWALIVEGEVPVRNLDRVMAHHDILKLAPALPSPGLGAARKADVPPSQLGRFLAFAELRSPLLLLLTFLALLPTLGSGLFRLLQIFIPYR